MSALTRGGDRYKFVLTRIRKRKFRSSALRHQKGSKRPKLAANCESQVSEVTVLRTTMILLILAGLLVAPSVFGQESRGSISGTVFDPLNAVIPGAQVVISNAATKLESRSTTNETGFFEAPLLNPGLYNVSVEAMGFKKAVRSGLEVYVGTRLAIEIRLEVGQLAESVEVTASAPLLETRSASGGRIVSSREVSELPVSAMNPFLLAGLAAGMQWTGTPSGMQRAFDVGATTSFNTAGAVGQNEYTLDGAPVTGTERRVGYVPPLDAVGEFRLETASFDASFGHTSGATVNVSSRSGANSFHGSLFDQHWQNRWNATPHFTRLAYEQQVRDGQRSATDQKQSSGRSNNYGGTFGGPVRVPRLFDGRDKLFFFVTYNGYAIDSPGTGARSVPHDSWYNGDFSAIQAVDAVKYTIYDPRSARQEGNRVVRTPFPGNRGVPVLSSVYGFYAKIYPKANNVPGFVTPEGINNHFDPAVGQKDRYQSVLNRIDYNVSNSHRTNGKWYWSQRQDYTGDWTRDTVPNLHDGGGYRRNVGGSLNHVWTMTGADLLDINLSITRFIEGLRIPVQASFKPTDAGFPKYLDEKAGRFTQLPRIRFSTLQGISREYPHEARRGRGTTLEFKPGMNSIRGSHTLKYGWSERRYWQPIMDPNNSAGSFTFSNTYMRANDVINTASNYGLEFAAFMMGLPAASTIDTNDSAYWTTRYRALYLQDEWRVRRRLTLNLGLRYEREGGIRERFNRGIGGQFYPDLQLPISSLVQAAYAASPLRELPASAFRVLGGTEYLGVSTDAFTQGTHKFLPRAGAAVMLDEKTVVRGGYGWFYDTLNALNTVRPSQFGYSQSTDTVISTDNGLTFCCGIGPAANLALRRNAMDDPFPVRADGTRFDSPYGNTLGSMANVGRGFTAYPWEFSPDWQQRWRIGLQRELPSGFVVELAYSGARSKFWNPPRINYLPEQFWADGNVRNQALDNDMNTNVPNPFHIGRLSALQTSSPSLYRYLSTQSLFTSTTIRKNTLLRSFPQMGTLMGIRPGGDLESARAVNSYKDLQLQLEKRFSRGFQLAVMYTRAADYVENTYFNEYDATPVAMPSTSIRPHRFVMSGIYEFPFGKGRRWLATSPLRFAVGGWQLSWIYQRQNGPPLSWGNRFFYGNLDELAAIARHKDVHAKDIHLWFDPSIAYKGSGQVPSGFVGFDGRSGTQPGTFHKRVFPHRLDSMRADGIRNWDIKLLRSFQIHEGLRFVVALDALNATNHTNFAAPDTDPTSSTFGQVRSVLGAPRVLQLNMRLEF